MDRSAGILLPIFSLPGRYGIGTLGREARAFVEFLQRAGQTWWQLLPVGPTGMGDCPYASTSTFAGNPLFVDLDALAEQGLLTTAELDSALRPNQAQIDYTGLYESREHLLRQAFARLDGPQAQAVRDFSAAHPWVREYALFQAVRGHFKGLPWYEWPDAALSRHQPEALKHWQVELAEDVAFHTAVQYWFFSQWAALKTFANQHGVHLMGDLPIYVSLDSADVWSERKEFLLDETGRPTKVAGVPPDYFCADGQLWGNPLYNWDTQKADGFGWWIRRVEGASALFDAIRIDHFRAFESYWAVPAGAKSAKSGQWEKGPGMDLLGVLTNWFPQVTYVAEDLGILTDAVHQLRDTAGLPGMRILEFAFSGPDNLYLPHNYIRNCICYTGTHDNDTAVGWYQHSTPEERAFAHQYLGVSGADAVRKALLRAGQGSIANLFVAQMQDYLGLGSEARLNVPGVAQGNWRWRLLPGQLTNALAEDIHTLTATYGRTK